MNANAFGRCNETWQGRSECGCTWLWWVPGPFHPAPSELLNAQGQLRDVLAAPASAWLFLCCHAGQSLTLCRKSSDLLPYAIAPLAPCLRRPSIISIRSSCFQLTSHIWHNEWLLYDSVKVLIFSDIRDRSITSLLFPRNHSRVLAVCCVIIMVYVELDEKNPLPVYCACPLNYRFIMSTSILFILVIIIFWSAGPCLLLLLTVLNLYSHFPVGKWEA